METKKVTLNNGTGLEVGKKYRLGGWDELAHIEVLFLGENVMLTVTYFHDSPPREQSHLIHNYKWLPYTEPTPQKEWKTFMIEIGWNGYTTREIVQCESLEIAERHFNGAISIIEVKLNIEPVNS